MKKFLVIGDSCKDVFQYGKCKRICPEAPVPIFLPTHSHVNEGMALNVANNISGLDENVTVITNDDKPVKTRYIDEVSNQMLLRIDDYDEVDNIPLEELEFFTKFKDYNGIIISDYNKGFLEEDDIAFIGMRAKEAGIPTFLDTKKIIKSFAKHISFIKINEREHQANEDENYKDFEGQLIVTLGSRGAWHIDKKLGTTKHYGIEEEHSVRDLSGAGDTFLAAFAVEYVSSHGDIEKAIKFANKCASWVVTQKGVVSINMDVVRKLYNT